jgi:serine/threonine-protein kinase HipA
VARELIVWLFSERLGRLSLVNGRLNFQYENTWLNCSDAVPVSCSLPLRAERFNYAEARPFFAGLLPDGAPRQMIAKQMQISQQNDFAMLESLGGECAGAISFLPPDQSPSAGNGNVKWLDEDALLNLLDTLPRRPLLAMDGLRLSLAGAQDKLPVIVSGAGAIGLPINGTPSTHILKTAIALFEDSVANEAFCMALAEVMSFKPARASMQQISDRKVYLVARYDRTGHPTERLHQEDFCQALGIAPEAKYQNDGGPSLAQCFALVRRVTRPSAPQVLRLLDYVIFNALIGNHDAHGKNFSLLYSNGCTTLAPLYDALSTVVYLELSAKMAMKIGSKYKFTEVMARHWDQFAVSAGLSKAQTRKRVLVLAQALPTAARRLQEHPDFAKVSIIEKIVVAIEQRAKLTADRLNAPVE